MIEDADWGAPSLHNNIGTVVNMAPVPNTIKIALNAFAVNALDCSKELQFRLVALNNSNNFPFTNFDGSYVVSRAGCSSRKAPLAVGWVLAVAEVESKR